MTQLIEPRLRKRAVFGALVLLTCIGASAASFDCAKAHSTSERLICNDPNLSVLDVRLARLAAEGKKRAPSPRRFQRELDAAWQVRQKCDNTACVELWYRKRIAVLSGARTVPAAPEEAPPRADAADPRPATRPTGTPAEVRTAVAQPAQVTATPAAPPPKQTVAPPAQVAATPAAPVSAAPVPGKAPAAIKPATVHAERQAKPPPAAVATAASGAEALQNVSPGAQLQVIGGELGFDVPLTKDDFLSRYSAGGGQCGASPNLAELKALSPSAVSDCWSGNACPPPVEGLGCMVVRTAYDGSGRLVLFSATLNTVGGSGDGTREMRRIDGKLAGLCRTDAKVRRNHNGESLFAAGSQGEVRLAADVTAIEGSLQVGVFSVASR